MSHGALLVGMALLLTLGVLACGAAPDSVGVPALADAQDTVPGASLRRDDDARAEGSSSLSTANVSGMRMGGANDSGLDVDALVSDASSMDGGLLVDASSPATASIDSSASPDVVDDVAVDAFVFASVCGEPTFTVACGLWFCSSERACCESLAPNPCPYSP